MYAIRNKKTKKWVYGTDYRHRHPRLNERGKVVPKKISYEQRTSYNKALTFGSIQEAEVEFDIRGCGLDYEIVEVYLYAKGEPSLGKWLNINNGEKKGEQ